LLEFIEQADVLDSDDRLVGKGFEQLDLRRREGAHFSPARGQRSNEFPLLTQGNCQKRAGNATGTKHWEFVLVADVGNVKRTVLKHPAKLWLINADLNADDGGDKAKMSPGNYSVSFPQPQHHIINPTNPRGAFDNGVEHRLHVRL